MHWMLSLVDRRAWRGHLGLLLIAGIAFIFNPLAAEACSFKCRYNQDCWECIQGGRYSNCFLDCNVCGGERCGPGGFQLGEDAAFVPEALTSLHRFPAQPLAEQLHPAVSLVFDWFWSWQEHASKAPRERIELEGGVVVAGQPRDFTLSVSQRGSAQLYDLAIANVCKLLLKVSPTAAGKLELEYDFEPAGKGKPKAGFVMVEVKK